MKKNDIMIKVLDIILFILFLIVLLVSVLDLFFGRPNVTTKIKEIQDDRNKLIDSLWNIWLYQKLVVYLLSQIKLLIFKS